MHYIPPKPKTYSLRTTRLRRNHVGWCALNHVFTAAGIYVDRNNVYELLRTIIIARNFLFYSEIAVRLRNFNFQRV